MGNMDQLISSTTTIVLGIIGIAILAVIVSKNANTAGVIGAGGSALAQDIGAAVSPVTGGGGFSGLPSMGFTGGLAPID